MHYRTVLYSAVLYCPQRPFAPKCVCLDSIEFQSLGRGCACGVRFWRRTGGVAPGTNAGASYESTRASSSPRASRVLAWPLYHQSQQKGRELGVSACRS